MIDPTKLNYMLRGSVDIYYIIQERLTKGIVMTNEEKVKHWVALADNDLVAAHGMIRMKQNLYAGFICQQAVEKIIKGYFIKVKDEIHPYIHDLLKLVKLAGLSEMLSDEQKVFLDELNPLYIEARYADYKRKMAQHMTDETTQRILTQTKEFVQWIKEKM